MMKNAPEKQTQNRPEEQKSPCKVCIRNAWPKKIKSKPKILYLTKLLFRNEEEINNFPDKQKLKQFISRTPALQEMPK